MRHSMRVNFSRPLRATYRHAAWPTWSAALVLLLGAGCERGGESTGRARPATITVDGSSTVAPIMLAAAEFYRDEHPRIQVPIGISGTGGGFKKFLEERPNLRIDIANASRPITEVEVERARALGVEFVELPIAYDGLAVAVHPDNTFCDYLTLTELREIWRPGSTITNWKDIRPGFPDLPLRLYGPGTDSGTFDYFTEVVMGEARACRADFTPSEDDSVLVVGVQGDRGSLGYFGYSYYEANSQKLKLVAIDNGDGVPRKPDPKSIRTLTYRPLARPLYLYVNRNALERPEVREFLDYVFANARRIVQDRHVNYVALSDRLYGAVRKRLTERVTGTVYADAGAHMRSLYELYNVAPDEP